MSRRGRGFTLLELLVVLGLLGLIAGLTAPRFVSMGEKLDFRNQQQTVQQRVNGLPLLAERSAQVLRIDEKGAPLELPPGWRVTARPPIVYQSNGACLGGRISVWQGHELQLQAELVPPLCQWTL